MEKFEDEYTVRHLSVYEGDVVVLGTYMINLTGGSVVYMKNGKVHRDGDQPAIITRDERIYARDGLIYREGDRPAYEHSSGLKRWYVNGLMHREGDLPAVEGVYGTYWCKNGGTHRDTRDENGYLLPAIVQVGVSDSYYLNDKEVDREGNSLVV